ncbi:IclR family transcriptional regulator [Halocynthiibacter sp. C4]|uniref:IclR family transcriptional regulator n=1 Tax=Halocynthiibacter sp. C4 TaxID=2992758 RepID=UPI00237C09B0|nr:IclR family transcriptional regulator [Halocynthiibacter sp. C4]MDE0591541.1 IclR family transcriptional regulator [Halocynthiibacter sp. C4]
MTKSETDTQTAKYNAPALSKGLDILELLASRNTGMKKSEIAKALDRSVSEIFRMLAVLEDRQYVSLDETSETYSLTPRLFEIAHRHPPIRRLTAVAGEVMENLAEELNQSLHLAILHGSDILVIAQTDPPGNNITAVRLGARVPIIMTASGVMLTYKMPAKKRDEIVARIDDRPAHVMEQFDKNIVEALETDFCYSPSAVMQGVVNLSAPIFSYNGDVVAALTIPYIHRLNSTTDADIDKTRTRLSQACQQLSQMIGAGAADGASEG